MSNNIRIYSSFISKNLENLLFEICKKEKKKEVHVAPFNRFGFSGSNLYLIFFSKEKKSIPHLLKTNNDKEKAKIEAKAMDGLKEKYRHSNYRYYSTTGLDGILLDYHSDDVSNKFEEAPKTFRNIIHGDINEKRLSDSEICKHIKNAFSEFRNVYYPADQTGCSIIDSYSRYLRNNITKNIIKDLTKSNMDDKKIDFFGQKITNPVYIMNNMIKKTTITKSLIHGDLHTDNIVINHEGCPRIIDFAWSTENDIYIDFSLLEMSIRYWGTPFFTNKYLKNEFERRTLKETVDIENVDIKKLDKKKLQRMVMLVNEIRDRCKEITGEKYDFRRYILSQFIVLYGLQKFTDKYNPFIVIPFLSKLGNELIRYKYVKEKTT
jgi:hypothetical protein